MKLYATDNSELMEVATISREGKNLVIEGTIMGAMPIRAIVKPAELRQGLKLMDFKTMVFAVSMFFRGSR